VAFGEDGRNLAVIEDLPQRVKKGGYKDIYKRSVEGIVVGIVEKDGGKFLIGGEVLANRIAAYNRLILLYSPIRKIDGGNIEWQGRSRVKVLYGVAGLYLGLCQEGE